MYKPITQKDFIKIALSDNKDWQIKYLAVNKIKNQKILEKIALKNGDYLIRVLAIQKLEDQKVFGEIILNEKNRYVKRIAINRLKELRN